MRRDGQKLLSNSRLRGYRLSAFWGPIEAPLDTKLTRCTEGFRGSLNWFPMMLIGSILSGGARLTSVEVPAPRLVKASRPTFSSLRTFLSQLFCPKFLKLVLSSRRSPRELTPWQ